MRVRHKASGGERDTGVVAGAFFRIKYFYFILLPIENRINIGGRGTPSRSFNLLRCFCPSACVVRQHLNIVSFFPATTSRLQKFRLLGVKYSMSCTNFDSL